MSEQAWNGIYRRAESISRHEFSGLEGWLKEVDDKLDEQIKNDVLQKQRLEQIEKNVATIMAIVTKLHDTFTQSKGAFRMLTLLITFLGGGWALLVWAKDHIRIGP